MRTAATGENNPMYGKRISAEAQERRRITFETNNKLGKHNYKGKKLSDETKDKIRMKAIGRSAWNKGLKSDPEWTLKGNLTREKNRKLGKHKNTKGMKRSQECKDKIRKSKLGHKQSLETVKKRELTKFKNRFPELFSFEFNIPPILPVEYQRNDI